MVTPRVLPGRLPLTEKQWQAQVTDYAHLMRWHTYHAFLSIHSPRGWPDLALVRPPRLILAEMKSEKGKATPAQQEWLQLLEGCPGVETYVWRPSDWPDVETVLR